MNPPVDSPQSLLDSAPPVEEYLGGAFQPLVRALSGLAESHNVTVYLVGGPVRDWLLGLPAKDLDFVVEGNAPELARELAYRTRGEAVVHGRFGTATVSSGNLRVDLATARRESYPAPGALPHVEPSTISDDLARRDFSINAMAVPVYGADKTLLDPQGGLEDLASRSIRILHAQSFEDDPTRLFRAVRYEQRLGFVLEKTTESRLLDAVKGGCLISVSGDRIRHELQKMFEEQQPASALCRAIDLGVMSFLNPTESFRNSLCSWETKGPIVDPEGEAGVLSWLAALCYPISDADRDLLARRLNMPSAWKSVLSESVAIRKTVGRLDNPHLLPSELAELLEHKSLDALFVAAAIVERPIAASNILRYLRELRHISPSLTGHDLMQLGIPGGVAVGQALARLRRARLDRQVNTEEEERLWVKNLIAMESLDSKAERTGFRR